MNESDYEFNKVIEGKRYYCNKVPVMKQLKLLPLLSSVSDGESLEANLLDLDYETLFNLLAKETKLACENVKVGDQEVFTEISKYMNLHFKTLPELMEVMLWALGQTFEDVGG